jgi:thioredoxin 1
MAQLKEVNEEDFSEEVESHGGPVIVDFWADWCGPCKQLAPRLEELAEQFPEVKIVKVDVDANQELARSFGIRSIPTLLFFEDGESVHELSGAVPTNTLVEAVESHFEVPVAET